MNPNSSVPEPAFSSRALEAIVTTESQAEHRGVVSSAQHGLVSIDFARETRPQFSIGASFAVVFRSRDVAQSYAARGRVVFRQDEPFRARYKFQFTDKDARALSALFDRRSLPRMRTEEDISVEVRAAGSKLAPYLVCHLRDISIGGLSLLVKPDVEKQLSGLDRLQLRFHLPGDDALFDLQADVRHRRLANDTIQYGLAFTASQPAGTVERIEAYIGRRKNEIIERALGSNWIAPDQ